MTTDDDDEATERLFTRRMLRMCDHLHTEIGYNPTVFRRMVEEHGGVETARRLLNFGPGQSGLERLWQHGRLADSMEAHVLSPQFESLFSVRDRRKARRRLEDHGFDVDAYLRRIAAEPGGA